MNQKNLEIHPIDEIERRHKGHWFSSGAKAFFKSHWDATYYRQGNKGYFISSERIDYDSPKLYTIRVYDFELDTINTVGDFQGFETKAEAIHYLKTEILK